jgi:hypothetical protein
VFEMDLGESMKPLLVATIIGIAAGTVAMQSPVVSGFVADIYPGDPARREALNLCAFADPNFNRLDRAARDACYQHALATLASTEQSMLTGHIPNQVDLAREAGRGSSPRNDVRILQQSDGFAR